MEHIKDTILEQYRAGTLDDSGDYARIEQHLRACDTCRARLAKPGMPVSAVLARTLAEWSHADDDALLRYARNPASAPPELAAHIADCSRCREDVAGLRAYLMAQSDTVSVLPPAYDAPEIQPAARSRDHARHGRRGLPVFAAGLTAACFAALLLFTIRLKQQENLQTDRARLAREQERTSEQAAQLSQQKAQETLYALQKAYGDDLADKNKRIGRLKASLTANETETRQMRARLHDTMQPPALPWLFDYKGAALQGADPERKLMGLGPGASDKQALELLGPIGRTLEAQPVMRWKPLPGAVRYTVTLANADAHDTPLGKPVSVAGVTEWKWEATLVPGRYTWQVEAYKQDSPDSFAIRTGHFEVLSSRSLSENGAAQLTPWVEMHLRLGDGYAKAGIFEEAEHEYRAALRLKPTNAAILKRLKAALKQQGKL